MRGVLEWVVAVAVLFGIGAAISYLSLSGWQIFQAFMLILIFLEVKLK